MDELRSRRALCQALEVGLSYQRRIAQGRLDLVGAERNQRSGGAPAPHVGVTTDELVEQLSGVLAERGRPTGNGRLPQLLGPEDVDVPTDAIDAIASPSTLANLADLDDEALTRLVEALGDHEHDVSSRRHQLHQRIDAFQAEIVRRYRTGEATVDALMT